MENDNKQNKPTNENGEPLRRPRPNMEALKNRNIDKTKMVNRVKDVTKKNVPPTSNDGGNIRDERISKVNNVKKVASDLSIWLQKQLGEYTLQQGDLDENDFNKIKKAINSMTIDNGFSAYINGQIMKSVMGDMLGHRPMSPSQKQNLPRISSHRDKMANRPIENKMAGIDRNTHNRMNKNNEIERARVRSGNPSGRKVERPSRPSRPSHPTNSRNNRGSNTQRGFRGDKKDPQWS